MRGRLWIETFVETMNDSGDKELNKFYNNGYWGEWTEAMMRVLDKVGQKLSCKVEKEFLNIDAMFFDKNDVNTGVLPRVVIEHENNRIKEDIKYSLFKILCVRSSIRVLICYQDGARKVEPLKQCLEETILTGGLMKGDTGYLLVIIGNETETDSWGDYFNAYEWKNDRLEKIEGLKW